jgi:hypothetical protein
MEESFAGIVRNQVDLNLLLGRHHNYILMHA